MWTTCSSMNKLCRCHVLGLQTEARCCRSSHPHWVLTLSKAALRVLHYILGSALSVTLKWHPTLPHNHPRNSNPQANRPTS